MLCLALSIERQRLSTGGNQGNASRALSWAFRRRKLRRRLSIARYAGHRSSHIWTGSRVIRALLSKLDRAAALAGETAQFLADLRIDVTEG